MLNLLIIGYGNHTKKNILPALARSAKVNISGIVVRNKSNIKEKEHKIIEYQDIKKVNFDAAYISTPISTHYKILKKLIYLCDHIICEKPLTLNSTQTKKILQMSKSNKVNIHEASMYRYHLQYSHLKEVIYKNFEHINTATATFSIPKLEKENIRYNKSLGGGGLLDVGFYPISILISLFGKPLKVKAFGIKNNHYDVILKGTALFKYKKFVAIANWGINSDYNNHFQFSAKNRNFYYDRIFSKPFDYDSFFIKKSEGIEEKFVLGRDDHFLNMIENMLLNKKLIKDYYDTSVIAKVMDIINSQINK